MLLSTVSYLLHPRVLFTHLIATGLLFDLHKKAGITQLVLLATAEELVTLLLWSLIPNSWSTILSLALFIYIYEKISGPRVSVQENAVFFADDDISDVFYSVAPDLNYEVGKRTDNKDGVAIQTDLRYVEFSPKSFAQSGEPHTHAIDLETVVAVQPGCDFNIMKSIRALNAQANQCFKFITNVGEKTVTLICGDVAICNQWLAAFNQLYGKNLEDFKTKWLHQLCDEANIEKTDGPIKIGDAVNILNNAKRPTDKAYIKEIFLTFAKSGEKSSKEPAITSENFSKFFDLASRRPQIHDVYLRLLDNKRGETVLNTSKFRNFLQSEQKELVSLPVVKSWIKDSETLLPGHSMTSIGFTTHLLSESHNIFKRECRQVYQDMNQPLSHYFIATSHNTYLTKDQLRSKSSVDMYTQAFKRGCKCVELDCWDGPNNEPIVYHGHTLTSKILFKDILKSVKEHAFAVSDYPVILSFENHCSVDQQKVMAQHLVDILQDILYTTPVPEDETQLKSPEQLKGYVIVKNKKLKEGVDETEEGDDEFSDEDINEDEVNEIMGENQEDENGNEEKVSKSPVSSEAVDDEGGEKKSKTSFKKLFGDIKLPKRSSSKKSKAPKLAQELSDLVHYCQAVSFKGFNYAKEHLNHFEMSSFGEKKIFKYAAENSNAVLDYTRKHMARTYPAGGRVDSSNYDPVPLWNVGCQLVALNYQTGTIPMQLNQGLFQDNGFCGYVLKPQFMRNDNSRFDPKGPFEDNKAKNLVIKVITGNQIPYKSENNIRKERELHIQVKTTGVEADVHKEKTKTVKNNGYNPVWDEEFEFKINVPELTLVTFTAIESNNTFLGQYTLPLRCLQQGYRIVPLQNKMCEPLPFAQLFVHVKIE